MDRQIKDISLLMLFMSSWEDEVKGDNPGKIIKAWKGILFAVLDELEKEALIVQEARGLKSPLVITDKGIKYAKELKGKFF